MGNEDLLADYRNALRKFDVAVCETLAVSQQTANRLELPAIGYSTHVFTRICVHAEALICAAPKSRWVKRNFDIWDISAIASHARSLLEGYLLFRYLVDAPTDLDTQRSYVQVMHLYDCKKRLSILHQTLSQLEIDAYEEEIKTITDRLLGFNYFNSLDEKLRKEILKGNRLTITTRNQQLEQLEFDEAEFKFIWNYLSQYTHVLSLSFYRMEPNGRGTGVRNSSDLGALRVILDFCTNVLADAVDRLLEVFPDAADARCGLKSKFSPGPKKNLPKRRV